MSTEDKSTIADEPDSFTIGMRLYAGGYARVREPGYLRARELETLKAELAETGERLRALEGRQKRDAQCVAVVPREESSDKRQDLKFEGASHIERLRQQVFELQVQVRAAFARRAKVQEGRRGLVVVALAGRWRG